MLDKLKKLLFGRGNQIEIENLNKNSITPPVNILELIEKYEKQYIADSKKTLTELKSKQLYIVNERLENTKTLTYKHVSKTKKIETLEGLKNSINRSNEEILKYKSFLSIRGVILHINGQLEVSKHLADNKKILEKIINESKENPIQEIKELELNQELMKEGIDKIVKSEFYMFLADYEENINNLCIERIDEMIENINNNLLIDNENVSINPTIEKLTNNNKNPNHLKNQIPENLKELLSIWHDKNDTVNLIKIYNEHESIFTNPTKKLISCFAYELYEKKWLAKFESNTFNATDIAKIFLKLANLRFYPNYKDDFNFLAEKPSFNIKFSKNVNIDMRKED